MEQNEVQGTVQHGGHGAIGLDEAAVCPNCGKKFMQSEIEELGRWVNLHEPLPAGSQGLRSTPRQSEREFKRNVGKEYL